MLTNNVRHTQGTHMLRVYLVGQEKPKANKQTKGIFILESRNTRTYTTQPSNFP